MSLDAVTMLAYKHSCIRLFSLLLNYTAEQFTINWLSMPINLLRSLLDACLNAESSPTHKRSLWEYLQKRHFTIELFDSLIGSALFAFRTYLRDLVEATHLFMKMLERHCDRHSHLVVQRRKKKVRPRKRPTKKGKQSSNLFTSAPLVSIVTFLVLDNGHLCCINVNKTAV